MSFQTMADQRNLNSEAYGKKLLASLVRAKLWFLFIVAYS